MKYHKIRGVDIKICSAEQKIAYNMASSYYDLFIGDYKDATTAAEREKVIDEAAQKMLNMYSIGYSFTPYDKELIYCALNAGLEGYFNLKYHILASYEAIGKVFPGEYFKEV